MNPVEWILAILNPNKWDYNNKLYKGIKHPEYAEFGNYNLGLTGTIVGFTADELLRGSGAVQIIKDLLRKYPKEEGWPWDIDQSTFGDQLHDQLRIAQGIEDAGKSLAYTLARRAEWPLQFNILGTVFKVASWAI